MSIDKNDPGSTSNAQTDGQIESLESDEVDGVDMETIVGGSGSSQPTFFCFTQGCKKG